MKTIANQDQHAAAAAIVQTMAMAVPMRKHWRLLMTSAMFGMTVAPQHQFFQDEETENAGQHYRQTGCRIGAGDDGMRQYFEKRHPEQRADGIADEHWYPARLRRKRKKCRGQYRQHAAEQRHDDDPDECGHGFVQKGKEQL